MECMWLLRAYERQLEKSDQEEEIKELNAKISERKEKVLGEIGLVFMGYNMMRCISILGAETFINALKKYCLPEFFAM